MKIKGIRIIVIERKILLCLSKIIILQPKFTKLRYYTHMRSLMGEKL